MVIVILLFIGYFYFALNKDKGEGEKKGCLGPIVIVLSIFVFVALMATCGIRMGLPFGL